MGEWVKYLSLGSLNKSLVGDKPLPSLFKVFLFYFYYFHRVGKPEMSIIFFFQLISWEMSVNFYIGFHKNKIKKFIGLNSQIFVIILGSF